MCHVLIIEDEALVAMHLQDVFQDAGATSFAFAETEAQAVREACRRPPDFISSDVELREGEGPRAVAEIQRRVGPLPVVFVTGTPEACQPCDPPARILAKPLHEPTLAQVFRELAPV